MSKLQNNRKCDEQSQTPATYPQLSKSKYCLGVQCDRALWLRSHHPELATPKTEGEQAIMDQGTEVGVFARTYFTNGVLVSEDNRNLDGAIATTKKLLSDNAPAIFEAAFLNNETIVRVDILRNNFNESWDIAEVKSGTGTEDNYLHDLAIQRFIVEQSGIKVRKTVLWHINNQAVFPDLTNLFTDVDLTEDVTKLVATLPGVHEKQLKTIRSEKEPGTKIGMQCSDPYPCSFKENCWKDIPEHSVFELTGVWGKTKFELFNRGVVRIAEIPEGEKISRSKPGTEQKNIVGRVIKRLVIRSNTQIDIEFWGAPPPAYMVSGHGASAVTLRNQGLEAEVNGGVEWTVIELGVLRVR